jgi:hypothetical protein
MTLTSHRSDNLPEFTETERKSYTAVSRSQYKQRKQGDLSHTISSDLRRLIGADDLAEVT